MSFSFGSVYDRTGDWDLVAIPDPRPIKVSPSHDEHPFGPFGPEVDFTFTVIWVMESTPREIDPRTVTKEE
jgi:hypothetical protein